MTCQLIKISELSITKMVAGNEATYSKVIMNGVVKEWVGIGWIDTNEIPDTTLYPTVD